MVKKWRKALTFRIRKFGNECYVLEFSGTKKECDDWAATIRNTFRTKAKVVKDAHAKKYGGYRVYKKVDCKPYE